MDGHTIGIFGTDKEQKALFMSSIAKKSEVEGMIVYHRNEAGKRYSLLDDPQFPEKIQGYSRIASICDYAYYLLPRGGKLSPPDGELAVLLESYGLPGTVEIIDGTAPREMTKAAFKGLRLADYSIDERAGDSSIIDFSKMGPSPNSPPSGALVYVDRAFSVKGVGTVVLGFILGGKVSVHDRLRAVPSSPERTVEVRGIQVNDEDYESAGAGIRVGLSLKGVDAKDLDKASWLDDGSFRLSDKLSFKFLRSLYYRQEVGERDLHVQLPGELAIARVGTGTSGLFTASLANPVPVWDGMRVVVVDLNGKNLRVAGGGTAVG
ncbi:MAG: EF-Tu/IF-2/RF-3 family GTPase [Nitrososphaerales archaeon]